MLDMHNIGFDPLKKSFKTSLDSSVLESNQKLIDRIRFPADQIEINPPDRQSSICFIGLVKFLLEKAILSAININLMPLAQFAR